jgi:hypothetical protein
VYGHGLLSPRQQQLNAPQQADDAGFGQLVGQVEFTVVTTPEEAGGGVHLENKTEQNVQLEKMYNEKHNV